MAGSPTKPGNWGDWATIHTLRSENRKRSCTTCVNYCEDGSCAALPIVIKEVGFNYWTKCGKYVDANKAYIHKSGKSQWQYDGTNDAASTDCHGVHIKSSEELKIMLREQGIEPREERVRESSATSRKTTEHEQKITKGVWKKPGKASVAKASDDAVTQMLKINSVTEAKKATVQNGQAKTDCVYVREGICAISGNACTCGNGHCLFYKNHFG